MMRRSLLPAGALVLAIGACGEQPAGPFVRPEQTPVVKVTVQRDTARGTTPVYLAGNGVRVSIFTPGDTLPLRQATADSKGTVHFVGLKPGTYIITPSLRSQSTVNGKAADTITVTTGSPADTVAAATFQVRLGATVSGILAAEYTTQQGFVRQRFAGVPLIVERETIANSNIWTTVATPTTDATGAYSVSMKPGLERYRVRFDGTNITGFPNDTLLFRGQGILVTPRGPVTVTGTNLSPDQNRTENLLYNFNTRITGTVFEDANGNGTFDAGEALAAGDTVNVQLRDATGARVLATTSVRGPSTTYTFSSLVGGTYVVTADTLSSRLNGTARITVSAQTVTIPNSIAGSTTRNLPVAPKP